MVASSTPPVAVFFGGRLRFGGPERRRYLTVANNKNGRGLDPGVIIIPAQDNLTIINNIMSLLDFQPHVICVYIFWSCLTDCYHSWR